MTSEDMAKGFKYVLEWSPKQRHFHWQEVEEMLRCNRDSFLHRGSSDPDADWLVMGFGDTPEELDRLREKLENLMDDPAAGEIELF